MYNLLIKSGAHCLAYGAGGGGFLQGHAYFIGSDLKHYFADDGGDKKMP